MDSKFFQMFGEGEGKKQPPAVGTTDTGSSQLSTPPPKSRPLAQDAAAAALGEGAPQGGEAAPAAPAQASPEMSASQAKLQSMFGGANAETRSPEQRQAMLEPSIMADGSVPMGAIPESPLSILDRARLGWVRTPANQQKVLESHYGSGNVQLLQTGADEAGFVVREKDGKWYQADPHLAWSKLGPLSYPTMDHKNMSDLVKDAPGDLAQFAGEYGLRAAGAAVAVGQAAPLIAASGPFAPVTAIGAAGVGAAGAEGADMLTRMAMPKDTTGTDMATFQQLPHQMSAAFLFGAEQEAGGQLFKIGGKAGIAALAKTVTALSDTPGGRYLASKILGGISGQGEAMARIRVEDPLGVAKYDSVAFDDAVNNTNKLGDQMKDTVQGLYRSYQERKAMVFGRQYDAIEAEASKLKFDPMHMDPVDGKLPMDPVSDMLGQLKSGGYMRDGKVIDWRNSSNVERSLSGKEQATLNYIKAQGVNIARKTSTGEGLEFQEMKNLIGTIDKTLYEQDGIQDANLRRILGDFRMGLKNKVVSTLKDANPEMAKKYVELDQKYGPAKSLMEDLSTLTEDQKVDGFIKKIKKDDGSFNSDLLGNLSDLLGTKDPTGELLKMHVAQNSTDFLGGKKMLKIIPGSPLMVSRATTAYSQAKAGAANLTGTVPYLNETMKFLKNLPEGSRKALLQNPAAVDNISRMVGSASIAEQKDKEALLKSVGIDPNAPNSTPNQ